MTFTTNQLNELRAGYATIDRVDPAAPTYRRMVALLDAMSVAQLEQVRDARIKFLSRLAINRLPASR